jgi:dTDP-4-dehydrorhamnose reductase
MSIQKILVTGANGQLGWELAQLTNEFDSFEFIFADRTQIDLSNPASFEKIIEDIAPDVIINTAAYTAVDKAETEKELAGIINTTAVRELARISKQKGLIFITFSTDYVFNGKATTPYLPDTPLHPVNAYGDTKAAGELAAIKENENTIIIRTSWVFSSHGNNFVKTMLRLMKERASLNVVGDQQGRPTYAKDLAMATLRMIQLLKEGKTIKGIYHYANQGETTWFGFAQKIKEIAHLNCTIHSITTDQFPTPAPRPSYSVLDTQKIESDLGLAIPHWEQALQSCYDQIIKG